MKKKFENLFLKFIKMNEGNGRGKLEEILKCKNKKIKKI